MQLTNGEGKSSQRSKKEPTKAQLKFDYDHRKTGYHDTDLKAVKVSPQDKAIEKSVDKWNAERRAKEHSHSSKKAPTNKNGRNISQTLSKYSKDNKSIVAQIAYGIKNGIKKSLEKDGLSK